MAKNRSSHFRAVRALKRRFGRLGRVLVKVQDAVVVTKEDGSTTEISRAKYKWKADKPLGGAPLGGAPLGGAGDRRSFKIFMMDEAASGCGVARRWCENKRTLLPR